ncbi:hypothetical protein C0J52_18857 [Blattella germanica]|nr:hypothetical protein C0J52_18857 [Blattella germanica]
MSPQSGYYLILICLITICIATPNSKSTEQQVSTVQSSDSKTPSPKRNQDVKSRVIHDNDVTSVKNLQEHVSSNRNNVPPTNPNATTLAPTEPPQNTGSVNPIINIRNIGTGAVVRGFYVFVGLGAIVVMYIVVRTIRLKRKKTTIRKYGVLANQEDVEMTPLGAEDEDDESTLFDMTKSRT